MKNKTNLNPNKTLKNIVLETAFCTNVFWEINKKFKAITKYFFEKLFSFVFLELKLRHSSISIDNVLQDKFKIFFYGKSLITWNEFRKKF